jgi:hypothetical protein
MRYGFHASRGQVRLATAAIRFRIDSQKSSKFHGGPAGEQFGAPHGHADGFCPLLFLPLGEARDLKSKRLKRVGPHFNDPGRQRPSLIDVADGDIQESRSAIPCLKAIQFLLHVIRDLEADDEEL